MKQIEKLKKVKSGPNFLRNLIILVLVFAGGLALGRSDLAFLDKLITTQSVQKQNLPDRLDYSGVEEVYSKLKNNFDGQLDVKKLEEGMRQGLVNAAGDPYTEYLDPEASKELEEDLSGSFEGIGAELGKDEESIVIVSPIAGFPAEKAGLKPKDVIAEINGESTFDLNLSEAVKKIRGPKGTKVKLSIIRDGKTLDFEITRDQIIIPSVTSEVLAGNIGVIKISRFGEDTTGLVTEYAKELKAKNVEAVILDLRGNPGGLLPVSVDVASIWLKKGDTILQEKRDGQVIKTYFASGNPILNGIPTVVLINEGSASASEIVAGALKDNNAATLIGEKSYGKGSVQEIHKLDLGGALKVTIARWFTPGGQNIDK
ncbi:MAG TPA: S41 family peptidase, partial [Patescibacteria group bacterium]|nr:S41 family peptidase [Patescibacteria group bacterium]